MHVLASGEQLFERAEAAAAELTSHGVGSIRVRIDHRKQMNRKSFLLELAVHAGVVAPEGADANDNDRNGLDGQTLILVAFLETLD